jgi:predicted transglutaminase-like cysteine proteinase
MPLGQPTETPPGLQSYCLRSPADCAPPTAADDAESMRLAEEWTMRTASYARARSPRVQPISLTTVRLTDEVREVNARVNRAIASRSDIETYGVVEYWATPLSSGLANPRGDCEDYVLEKRRALLAEGVPARALSIAVVMTPKNILHVVLLVSTDRGELVLDSLTPWIVSWDETGYRWIKREKNGSARNWITVAAG